VLKAEGNIWNLWPRRKDRRTNSFNAAAEQCVSQVRRRWAVDRKWRLSRSTDQTAI